ncbi:MAG: anhydro-N-acetylmuramic acid kinase [Cyclobacteriaceae bacterium]|nr:anhydro-N-acetylmuramic acid kinase [Cyclobacteriaceae bacterium]
MTKNNYKVIGIMSGTSLDGLDIAFCEFKKKEGQWSFKLNASKSIIYKKPLMQVLKNSIQLPALELLLLNNEYGQWLGEQVKTFVVENNIKADFVSSHGHTVFHQPEKGITYQIGAGQEIANSSGMMVINDFRTLDVSLDGQGAPLVPIGDKHLFSEYDFCLNLGGISNISFEYKNERIAYDIGVANMALNHLTNPQGLSFDNNGDIARSGKRCDHLFHQLNELPYYKQTFPKSTGYEWFCDQVAPILDNDNNKFEDKLCTCVHHIAYQVAEEVKKHPLSEGRLLVTGGGANNLYLMETLQQYLPAEVELVIPNKSIINFKEAIVFAFMGVLKHLNEDNCLKSVTGAFKNSCSGVVFNPN